MDHTGPCEFIRFTKLAFTKTSACCIVNGQRTEYFQLPGGGRQGDNLYPLIFCIVMQVMHIAISMHNLKGIEINDNCIVKLGKYADDTTIVGMGHDDYVKLRNGIHLFERASGMNVNWDKSIIIKLGTDFPLLDNDAIKVLPHGQKTRVLGVMMGHEEDTHNTWVTLHSKFFLL